MEFFERAGAVSPRYRSGQSQHSDVCFDPTKIRSTGRGGIRGDAVDRVRLIMEKQCFLIDLDGRGVQELINVQNLSQDEVEGERIHLNQTGIGQLLHLQPGVPRKRLAALFRF